MYDFVGYLWPISRGAAFVLPSKQAMSHLVTQLRGWLRDAADTAGCEEQAMSHDDR